MHIEKHPFPEFIPQNVKALVVGSFPPLRLTRDSRSAKDKDFYYGSRENLFWKLMGETFGETLETTIDIQNFLGLYGIGVTDIIEECTRKSSGGKVDSSDSALCNIKYRDVIATISENNINKVYCTSKYVKDLLLDSDKEGALLSRKIDPIVLPSPSPSYSRSIGRSREYKTKRDNGSIKDTFEYRLEIYKKAFSPITAR